MRKYWWTVWIKVAVIALVLFVAYQYVSDQIEDLVSPYLIEQSEEELLATEEVSEEAEEPSENESEEDTEKSKEEDENLVMSLLGKIEEAFNVKIDFENMIFDYANEYAQQMMEQSHEERDIIFEPLS